MVYGNAFKGEDRNLQPQDPVPRLPWRKPWRPRTMGEWLRKNRAGGQSIGHSRADFRYDGTASERTATITPTLQSNTPSNLWGFVRGGSGLCLGGTGVLLGRHFDCGCRIVVKSLECKSKKFWFERVVGSKREVLTLNFIYVSRDILANLSWQHSTWWDDVYPIS